MFHRILVPFWAAGFSFSKAHLRDNVKFDPHTRYMFHGEEFHFATRAWTHGYDFYSPPYDIAFHRYYDAKSTKRLNINHIPQKRDNALIRDGAEKRVNALWGVLELRASLKGEGEDKGDAKSAREKADLRELENSAYSLGDKRSLSDFWDFAGIDITNMEITVFPTKRWSLGGLDRVTWKDESIDPVSHPQLYGEVHYG